MQNVYVQKLNEKQDSGIQNAMQKCLHAHGDRILQHVNTPQYNETVNSVLCPATFDGILCWPDALPGRVVTRPCPLYIIGFTNATKRASRLCTEGGMWFVDAMTGQPWSNYTDCASLEKDKTTVYFNINRTEGISDLFKEIVPLVSYIEQTGYMLSLVSLIIALAVMLFIKKLHCARNILHMHLFVSFILRAFTVLLKDVVFYADMGLPSDFLRHTDETHNNSIYFHVDTQTNNWTCKLMVSFSQYFILANYSWILMEGLFLHNLIFRAMFADSNKSIRWYILAGWGAPLIVIVKWVVLRVLYEDSLCWTTHENYKFFLVIAAPTAASILINLFLFIRISIVLYRKLRSPVNEDFQRYRKWVKSTLVLIPLFGVQYVPFLFLLTTNKAENLGDLVLLICDRVLSSFQGFVVAILYCFLNGEVKSEVRPHLYWFLTLWATHKWAKYLFPCRRRFMRSVAGRASVCTTMSCSSLYTNGVLRRNSKARLDSLPRIRPHTLGAKCHNFSKGAKSLQDVATNRSRSFLSISNNRLRGGEHHRRSQPLGNKQRSDPEMKPVNSESSLLQQQREYHKTQSHPDLIEETEEYDRVG